MKLNSHPIYCGNSILVIEHNRREPLPLTKESIIENTYLLKISPTPSFPKRGNPSLWKREVRRDFIKQCRYYYGPINNIEGWDLIRQQRIGDTLISFLTPRKDSCSMEVEIKS
ncbi:MAG: hypothetical protein A2026_11435 [Deltaproteobacteria bacterium RBG_19FT_COMBO_46_12]|nr:MAG: hypothetical protein A2026_11435 [Deltaproteobacteria bacterium RBG_19FT_COMBO_46_12]